MVVLRLALPSVAFSGVHIIRLRRTVFVESVGNALVGERTVLQTLLDRGGRGIAGQRPNASRVPPEMIGRERRRVDRVLHAGLRSVSLALHTLAEHLAVAADALRLLACPPFGGFLIGTPPLHLAERAFA